MAPFVQLAEQFCELVEASEGIGREELLHRMHTLLPRLYAQALLLPNDPEGEDVAEEDDDSDEPLNHAPDPDRSSHEAWQHLYKSLGEKLGSTDFYAEIFDPYHDPPEEAVMGSLADDFADIYRDLKAGLLKWSRGERDAAVWHWRFDFEAHWGEHASGALRAIHVQASTYELGYPKQPPPDA